MGLSHLLASKRMVMMLGYYELINLELDGLVGYALVIDIRARFVSPLCEAVCIGL